MEFLVSLAIGFTFLIIALAMYYNGSQTYKIRIAKLQARNQELTMKIKELMGEIEILKSESSAFRDVEAMNLPQVGVPDHAPGPVSEPAPSVVATLLHQGLVTQEQIAKAERYKRDNASPYSIEEILVLLNMVAPSAISDIRGRS